MKTSSSVFRIGISGSYGGLNLGDEAILKSMITQLRRTVPVEITVFSRNAYDTGRTQAVDRSVPVRSISRDEVVPEIERLDLFILGGGGIIFDGDARTYMREVTLAHANNVPVMTYAIGAGPLKDPENQKIVSENLNKAQLITVREHSAKKVLDEAGVNREITITADPALLLEPEPLAEGALVREGIATDRRLIGISVREPGLAAPDIDENSYHAILANVADYMVERFNADVVFVPMERKTCDLQHSHAIISQMLRPERASVLKGEYSPGQILTLMKSFAFAVGMRLHFLIFAAMQDVPFVALPYASKVTGFLEDLKIATPPLHLINSGRILAHIDRIWDERMVVMSRVKQLLPEQQKKAAITNQLLLDLLKITYPGRYSTLCKEKTGAAT